MTARFAPTTQGPAAGDLVIRSSVGDVKVALTGATPPAGTLACENGQVGTSWRDLLPPRPAPATTVAVLPASSGAPTATCTGEPTVVTDPNQTSDISSRVGHVGGRWYFEATIEQFTQGWSTVGVAASPALMLPSPLARGTSAAAIWPSGTVVVSVLADLDSGVAHFYEDGVWLSSSNLALLPGIGAFHAGGTSMVGNQIRFNFGDQPFAYGIPSGWSAWSTGAAAGGVCTGELPPPLTPAPIDVLCEAGQPCGADTFLTGAGGTPELIVIGTYDSGSTSSWEWQLDANGNPIQVTVGPGQNGSVLVEVNRPGPVVLVLAAYEPTDWTLKLGPGATLASVSAYGMHLQSVTGVPAGVPVDSNSICTGGNGGNCPGFTGLDFPIGSYSWPFDALDDATQDFVDMVEKRFCLPLALFAGGGRRPARGGAPVAAKVHPHQVTALVYL